MLLFSEGQSSRLLHSRGRCPNDNTSSKIEKRFDCMHVYLFSRGHTLFGSLWGVAIYTCISVVTNFLSSWGGGGGGMALTQNLCLIIFFSRDTMNGVGVGESNNGREGGGGHVPSPPLFQHRPLNSHCFTVRLKVIGQSSRSCPQISL